ncbi:hypothetical protein, partial [Streptomyces sp. NPDC007355]|uniref:hypothetical protein n=1 Tax=Streptomyces sp. NPDC007355 TaxID=3364778 RepID=UPI0036C42250
MLLKRRTRRGALIAGSLVMEGLLALQAQSGAVQIDGVSGVTVILRGVEQRLVCLSSCCLSYLIAALSLVRYSGGVSVAGRARRVGVTVEVR